LNAAVSVYSVQRAKLRRDLHGIAQYYAVKGENVAGSVSDLPRNVEDGIKSHVLKAKQVWMFGLPTTLVWSLAYKIAIRNNIEDGCLLGCSTV
jgi:hypothetical protein